MWGLAVYSGDPYVTIAEANDIIYARMPVPGLRAR
jgi:hypothetical protein